jgi:hypothetical protein
MSRLVIAIEPVNEKKNSRRSRMRESIGSRILVEKTRTIVHELTRAPAAIANDAMRSCDCGARRRAA